MLALLGRRDFALLFWAQVVSTVGDWVRIAAVPFYVFSLTGSPLATGATLAAQLAPGILLGSWAGIWIDRWPRRPVLVLSDLSRALLALALLPVQSPESVWIVYAVGGASSVASTFFTPARLALLPRLVPARELGAANALDGAADNAARIVGPALGGAVLASGGLVGIVLLDAASFVVSAALLALMRMPRDTEARAAEDAEAAAVERPRRLRDEWADGLRLVVTRRAVAALFLLQGIAMLGDSMIGPLFVLYCSDVLRAGPGGFGWLLAMRGVGGIAGGLLLGYVRGRVAPSRLLALGLVSTGLLFAALVAVDSLARASVVMILIGITAVLWLVNVQWLLQANTPDRYRGRVFGALTNVVALSVLVGTMLGAALANVARIPAIVVAAAALYVIAGTLAIVLLRTARGRGEETYDTTHGELLQSLPGPPSQTVRGVD